MPTYHLAFTAEGGSKDSPLSCHESEDASRGGSSASDYHRRAGCHLGESAQGQKTPMGVFFVHIAVSDSEVGREELRIHLLKSSHSVFGINPERRFLVVALGPLGWWPLGFSFCYKAKLAVFAYTKCATVCRESAPKDWHGLLLLHGLLLSRTLPSGKGARSPSGTSWRECIGLEENPVA